MASLCAFIDGEMQPSNPASHSAETTFGLPFEALVEGCEPFHAVLLLINFNFWTGLMVQVNHDGRWTRSYLLELISLPLREDPKVGVHFKMAS